MSFFEGLGVTEAEAREDLAGRGGAGRVRDGRVCACGHAMSRHETVEAAGRETRTRCAPSKTPCPCQVAVPVLEASDTRSFLARTDGPGAAHALTRGVVASMARAERTGIPIEIGWTVPVRCMRPDCETALEGVQPTPIAPSGFVAKEPAKVNVLACAPCREAAGK